MSKHFNKIFILLFVLILTTAIVAHSRRVSDDTSTYKRVRKEFTVIELREIESSQEDLKRALAGENIYGKELIPREILSRGCILSHSGELLVSERNITAKEGDGIEDVYATESVYNLSDERYAVWSIEIVFDRKFTDKIEDFVKKGVRSKNAQFALIVNGKLIKIINAKLIEILSKDPSGKIRLVLFTGCKTKDGLESLLGKISLEIDTFNELTAQEKEKLLQKSS